MDKIVHLHRLIFHIRCKVLACGSRVTPVVFAYVNIRHPQVKTLCHDKN